MWSGGCQSFEAILAAKGSVRRSFTVSTIEAALGMASDPSIKSCCMSITSSAATNSAVLAIAMEKRDVTAGSVLLLRLVYYPNTKLHETEHFRLDLNRLWAIGYDK